MWGKLVPSTKGDLWDLGGVDLGPISFQTMNALIEGNVTGWDAATLPEEKEMADSLAEYAATLPGAAKR